MNEEVKEHVQALREYVKAMSSEGMESSELRVKKSQLSAIQNTIRQLDRKSIPVPDSLKTEKISLAAAVGELERNGNDGTALYDALLDLVADLGQTLGLRPHNELYKKLREWRKQRMPQKTIRDALIATLKSMGGSGKEPEILAKLHDKLGDKLSDADLEKLHGRKPRWHTTVRSVRNKLIKEGILTQESRRRTWTLAK